MEDMTLINISNAKKKEKEQIDGGAKTEVEEKKKRRSRYGLFYVIIVAFILIASVHLFLRFNFAGKPPQTVEFAAGEVMRINNEKVAMNEFLLYAADVYQGYNLQNEANWDQKVNDSENHTVTFEEKVKGTICEQIRMTKILCMKAQDEGILLSSDEKRILADNAQTYYNNLISANAINKALTLELIEKFYEENALAQKIYNSIVNSYNEKQDTSSSGENDTEDTEISKKELYFIDVYHDLEAKYNKNYDYYTSINWNLLDQLSFSDMASDSSKTANSSEAPSK